MIYFTVFWVCLDMSVCHYYGSYKRGEYLYASKTLCEQSREFKEPHGIEEKPTCFATDEDHNETWDTMSMNRQLLVPGHIPRNLGRLPIKR